PLQLRHPLRSDLGARATPGGDPDVLQRDLGDRTAGYAGDRRRGHRADGHDVRDGHVLERTGHGCLLSPATIPQANEDGRPNIGHQKIRHDDVLQRAAVDHLERDAGAQVTLPRVRPADDRAMAEDDILEVAGRFGTELESIVNGGEMAVGHPHVLRGATSAQGEARLEDDRVVPRLDVAGVDPDIAAAVGIDPVGVSIPNGDALNIDAIAAEETDVVVWRIDDGQLMNRGVPTSFQSDRLGTSASRPVPVDSPWPENAEANQVAALEKGKAEVRGLRVRMRVMVEALDRIEIRRLLAGDQHRARPKAHGDVAPQMERAREIIAGRKEHGSARPSG